MKQCAKVMLGAGGRSRSHSRRQNTVLVNRVLKMRTGRRWISVVLGLLALQLRNQHTWKTDLGLHKCSHYRYKLPVFISPWANC